MLGAEERAGRLTVEKASSRPSRNNRQLTCRDGRYAKTGCQPWACLRCMSQPNPSAAAQLFGPILTLLRDANRHKRLSSAFPRPS